MAVTGVAERGEEEVGGAVDPCCVASSLAASMPISDERISELIGSCPPNPCRD